MFSHSLRIAPLVGLLYSESPRSSAVNPNGLALLTSNCDRSLIVSGTPTASSAPESADAIAAAACAAAADLSTASSRPPSAN